jgi:protein ImuB
MTDAPPRMVAVWCPDWPVTTARLDAGLDAEAPVAVVAANLVTDLLYAVADPRIRLTRAVPA